jgi:hypothetical protein
MANRNSSLAPCPPCVHLTTNAYNPPKEGFLLPHNKANFSLQSVLFDSQSVLFESKSILFDSQSMDFDSESMDFDSESMDFDSESMDFDSESMDFDSESVDFDSESTDFDSESMDFDSESMDFDMKSKPFIFKINGTIIPCGRLAPHKGKNILRTIHVSQGKGERNGKEKRLVTRWAHIDHSDVP